MAVPYTFGSATSAIPLSQLDANFATGITLGNTTVYLGNTTTSFGNVTLVNATVSSGNVTANLANSTVDGTNAVGYLTIPQDAQPVRTRWLPLMLANIFFTLRVRLRQHTQFLQMPASHTQPARQSLL